MPNTQETQSYITKIKHLLETDEEANLLLACQLIESNQLPIAPFINHLYVWWEIHYDEGSSSEKALYKLLNQSSDKAFRRYFQTRQKSNLLIAKGIGEDTVHSFMKGVERINSLNTSLIANLILQLTQAGGAYCLENNTAPAEKVIGQLIDRNMLGLGCFGLSYLPTEIGLFPEITHLYLDDNLFTEIPQALQNLTNVEEISWQNTPLSDEAIQSLESFFPVAMAHHYFQQGKELGQAGDYKQAKDYGKKATTLNPQEPKYWLYQGVYLENIDQQSQAIDHYEKTIALDPSSVIAFSGKGSCLVGLKRYEEAIMVINAGLDLPNIHQAKYTVYHKHMHYHKGIAYYNLLQYEASHEAYDQTLFIDPDFAHALYGKACIYAEEKQKYDMLEYLQRAIAQENKYRFDAPLDEDLKNYWDDEDFIALVQAS